ncbi:AraC family transcriptional regulator [Paenibacillus sp. HWE-109]|uniref:helix-turn-helix domain-containing protein n=1 Tax=Paenibacillus sp. HWE-109 TaxID=1306526 RepID=UPI001EDE1A3E|nr:AraC family transcriptional regulator [Paenibacillus sp. HWE-109]UKS28593.1 AraC family transcriptional regulator [Paenibacillus sp. HWE-109]
MEIFKEPIPYQNASLCMKVWRFCQSGQEQKHGNAWHYHKEVEFILVEKGRHEIQTTNHTYLLNAGDVMVIGSSQLHRGRKIGDQDLVYIVLHIDLQPYFDPAMMMYYRHFLEIFQPLEELNYIFRENEQARKDIGRIITETHNEVMDQNKGFEIAVSMHMKHLLLLLLRHDNREVLTTHVNVDADVDIIRSLAAYVDDHLTEKIDLGAASQLAGMSYSYFSKYFKKKMGSSFIDYVNRKRISKAERMLVTETRSVGEIAQSVGIENMAHFYELFKRFNGCTPKQYLHKMCVESQIKPSE